MSDLTQTTLGTGGTKPVGAQTVMPVVSPTTKIPFRWPTEAEESAAFPHRTLEQEMLAEKVRQVEAAFAAGADYVSLTMAGREIGRIYPDGRHWSPPL